MRIVWCQPVRVISGTASADQACWYETRTLDADVAPGWQLRLRYYAHDACRVDRVHVAAELVRGDERSAERAEAGRRHGQTSLKRGGGAGDDLRCAGAVDRED